MNTVQSKSWDKIADEYHEYIISPLHKDVVNPLCDILAKLPSAFKKSVIDIGTGNGDLISFLVKHFEEIHASDFSEKMLVQAKRKNVEYTSIMYHNAMTEHITKHVQNVHVAIAVNSIISPELQDIDMQFKEINTVLVSNGFFIGIFPSMEAILHYFRLVYERELCLHASLQKSLRKTRSRVDFKDYDFIRGTYTCDGHEQKLFTRSYLTELFCRHGFDIISLDKVEYPWNDGNGDFDNFKGKEKMWDWIVYARKK
ncbi:MAG: methyltransferase domain-containing protein [Candidatus Woesearchaeota archaeon]